MARITVEDCLDKVDNRFQLVMIASKRARQLQIEGKEPKVPVDKDKPTVIALREIAEGLVDVKILNEKPVLEMQDRAKREAALAQMQAEQDLIAEPDADEGAAPADLSEDDD